MANLKRRYRMGTNSVLPPKFDKAMGFFKNLQGSLGSVKGAMGGTATSFNKGTKGTKKLYEQGATVYKKGTKKMSLYRKGNRAMKGDRYLSSDATYYNPSDPTSTGRGAYKHGTKMVRRYKAKSGVYLKPSRKKEK